MMKISVVIPAYNEEKLIGQCLEANLDQTFPREDYEILVIDNNSTDKTAEIAKSYGVKVISYTEKKGAIWAKQYGASIATGDIIVVTDADTIPDHDWIQNISLLMQDPKLMCVGGTVLATGSNRFAISLLKSFDLYAQLNQMIGIPFIWGSNMAFRNNAFHAIGGFNTKLQTGDDWEFTMRIQKKYGIRSAIYSNKLRVKSSPRKHEKINSLVPYVGIGIINFITIFILRKSITFGTNPVVR